MSRASISSGLSLLQPWMVVGVFPSGASIAAEDIQQAGWGFGSGYTPPAVVVPTSINTARMSGAMTFGDLRAEVLSWLDESVATAGSSTFVNVTNAIKQAHINRLTEDQWKFMLWPQDVSITTVANQQVYALHQEYLRPYYFRNVSRKTWLNEVPGRGVIGDGLDLDEDVDTNQFSLWGRSPVSAQPTSPSVISITSSSADDISSNQAITIIGDTPDGVASETITPTGQSASAGEVEFTNIIEVTKGASWAGTMTMTSNSGAVTNLKLFAAEFGRSYPLIQLHYLPTPGEVLKYRFYRKPKDLNFTNDFTSVPPPFERILVFDALLLLAAYDNRLDQGRKSLWSEYRDQLDMQMRQTYIEGQSLGARPRLIGGYASDGPRMRFD